MVGKSECPAFKQAWDLGAPECQTCKANFPNEYEPCKEACEATTRGDVQTAVEAATETVAPEVVTPDQEDTGKAPETSPPTTTPAVPEDDGQPDLASSGEVPGASTPEAPKEPGTDTEAQWLPPGYTGFRKGCKTDVVFSHVLRGATLPEIGDALVASFGGDRCTSALAAASLLRDWSRSRSFGWLFSMDKVGSITFVRK